MEIIMFSLTGVFRLLLILGIGWYVWRLITSYYSKQEKKSKASFDPRKAQKRNREEGEYVDYEEVE